jgi:hypothetical protein
MVCGSHDRERLDIMKDPRVARHMALVLAPLLVKGCWFCWALPGRPTGWEAAPSTAERRPARCWRASHGFTRGFVSAAGALVSRMWETPLPPSPVFAGRLHHAGSAFCVCLV